MRKKCCLALITFSMRGDFMNTKLLTSILQSSNDLITSEDFLTRHRIGNAFTRSGKLSFSNLIYFVLQSVHKSIPINYAPIFRKFFHLIFQYLYQTGNFKGKTGYFS